MEVLLTMNVDRRLAELLGWKQLRKGYLSGNVDYGLYGSPPDNPLTLRMVPDYPNDLNAMAEVEAELEKRGLWDDYSYELELQFVDAEPPTRNPEDTVGWYMFKNQTAAASVRAECAVEVLGGSE
jgi:hypothetical protein